MMLIDIDGADGGNIGCKLMSNVPSNNDRFVDLIVNGRPKCLLPPRFSLCRCASLSLGNCTNINTLKDPRHCSQVCHSY